MEVKKIIEELLLERDAEIIHYYTDEAIKSHKERCDYLIGLLDKQEQGLLIELPYPLETEHIYFADENDMDVYKLDAEKIEVHMMPISKKIMYTIDCYEFFIEDFGKIVFLKEAEAEEALARMKGE